MSKKRKNMFVLDCPVCREPGLPQQLSDGSFRLMHANRPIATCRVKEGTDAAETIRERFHEQFGSAYADATPEAVTGEISALTAWSTTPVGFTNPDYQKKADWLNAQVGQHIASWENEGGTCSSNASE